MNPEGAPTDGFRVGNSHDETKAVLDETSVVGLANGIGHDQSTLAVAVEPDAMIAIEPTPTIGVETPGHASPTTASSRFLGGYELGEELARGGMGIVYRAWQVNLTRWVALKLVRDPSLASHADIRRFRIEAEAVAQLKHNNIVPIYEIGQIDDQPYFSMLLIEGGNLTHNIPRFKDEPRAIAGLMVKVARAIHHAHQHAILHRDLKPSNILIGDHDEPYVADFGLAKRIESGTGMTDTVTGAIMGTPAYMPPEQAGGGTKSLTTAADIYSLGATLYEVLTGQPPFSGNSPATILRSVLEEEPARPKTINPKVVPDLETICLKCLEKNPGRRYGTAEDLADDLQRWLDHRPITARPVKTWEHMVKWVRRKPALAALVAVSVIALVGLVIGGGYFTRNLQRALDVANRDRYSSDLNLARRAYDDNEVYRTRDYLEKYRDTDAGLDIYRSFEWFYLWKLCHPERTILKGHGGSIKTVVYSPDGRHIASGSADQTVRIWDAEQCRTDSVLEGHEGSVLALAFTRDSQMLASGSMDGTVRLWNVATGAFLRSLDVGRRVTSVSFHPDGKTLALFHDIEDKLELWDVELGRKMFSLTTAPDRPEQPSFASVNTVVFSPDGSQIVVTDNDGNGVGVWNLRERSLKKIPNGMHIAGLSYSGDGRRLVTLSSQSRISVFNATTLEKQDFAGIGSASVGSETPIARASLACSSSSAGELVAFRSARNFIHIWHLDTGRRIDAIASGMFRTSENSLAFRPDGQRLAIGTENDVAIIPLSTRQQTNTLASAPDKRINALSVRGDRRRIAWTANDDPHVMIWDPLLKQQVRSLDGHLKGVLALSFGPPTRPDLLASADADGNILVWDSSTAGPPRRILNGHTGMVQDVAILPDGRTVVSAGSDGKLRVWDVDTGNMKHLLDGEAGNLLGLAVSPDGRYVAAACGDQSVLVWNVQSGGRWLGPLAVGGIPNDLAFSPDGSQIAAGGSKAGPGGQITVFNAHSGEMMSQWETPSLVRTLVFSSDGRRVVTGGTDGTIVVWDTVTGRETITLEGHKQAVLALVATPGLELYSAGIDGTVKLWEGLDPGPLKAKPLAADNRQMPRPQTK